jgi:hypothetical protein
LILKKKIGFFDLTSTGTCTIINKIIGRDVAHVGAYETTKWTTISSL